MDSKSKQNYDVRRRWDARFALLGMLGFLVVLDVNAGYFQRVYASSNATKLAEWGRKYELGQGVRSNMNRAIRLYCKAARKGNATAQYRLGWIYSNGHGVERDDGIAVAWFRKAARQNHPQSRNMLKLVRAKKKKRASCPLSGRSSPPGSRPHPAKPEVMRLVQDLAPEYGVNPELVLAVIEVESNYDPKALSPKNAQGLMQLIPETAKRFGVADVWDPKQNLRGGVAYLRWLLDHFNGDIRLALAGYNAGEASVVRYRGVPPFDETKAYVRLITGKLNRKLPTQRP